MWTFPDNCPAISLRRTLRSGVGRRIGRPPSYARWERGSSLTKSAWSSRGFGISWWLCAERATYTCGRPSVPSGRESCRLLVDAKWPRELYAQTARGRQVVERVTRTACGRRGAEGAERLRELLADAYRLTCRGARACRGRRLVRAEDGPPWGKGIIVRNAPPRIPVKHNYQRSRIPVMKWQDSKSFWAIPKGLWTFPDNKAIILILSFLTRRR